MIDLSLPTAKNSAHKACSMTRPVILPTVRQRIVLDIGGEGRHADAWNLNPSPKRTFGRDRGRPIPRRIAGRAEAIPLARGAVDWLIVERTPLSYAALKELARVVSPSGRITLRHVPLPWRDRHALARSILPGRAVRRMMHLGGALVQETEFWLDGANPSP